VRVPLGRAKQIRPSDRGDPDEGGPGRGCQAGWSPSAPGIGWGGGGDGGRDRGSGGRREGGRIECAWTRTSRILPFLPPSLPPSLPPYLDVPPWVEPVELRHDLQHRPLHLVITACLVPARPTPTDGIHLEGGREGWRDGEKEGGRGEYAEVRVVALCPT